MAYIVINEKEIVKAEMERPERPHPAPPDWNIDTFIQARKKFQQHCLSLPRIPIEGEHKWKVWQEVVDGKDLKLQHQIRLSAEWVNANQMTYDINKHNRRIIAIPIQPTPEPRKIKKMTITEKKQPRFGVNDDVYILDTQIYDKPKWIHGVVEEVGEETILVKWDDLTDPTEYELSDLPDIRHTQPTPEGEKVEEKDLDMALLKQAYNIISRLKNVEDQFLQIACDEWLEIYSEHNNLLTNDNTQTK